ncbi:MAG: hypothetical protein K2G55_14825 [Lachnospiraceae bacterium]|nr:hypothetical protein [Lachnospiraceae bacterium]MDE7201874.1 hypothetical protein [Lachnospiraceae bacterium]
MKNIQIYQADKYSTSMYTKVEENIYKGKNPYYHGGSGHSEEMYVTSLTFEQEPELGEGETPKDISQYPLEGILELFSVCVSDFYDELNAQSESTCYQEFGSSDLEDVRKLLGIVGKHVYEKKFQEDDLSEEELEEYKGMSEEELEEEGIIWYDTVVE